MTKPLDLSGGVKRHGVSGSCPSPVSNEMVSLVMGGWGRYVWRNRESAESIGFPASCPLAMFWESGAASPGGLVLTAEAEPMSPMVVMTNEMLDRVGDPARLIAWLYWAYPDSAGSVEAVAREATRILPFRVSYRSADRWLGAVSGAVLNEVGDFSGIS